MNYELAKKLKDAGFPQNGGLLYYAKDTMGLRLNTVGFQKGDMIPPEGSVLIPSLSNLIEACGDDFESLERYVPEQKMPWRTLMSDEAFEKYSVDYPCVKECCGYEIGDTPEESVANLWLKINTPK